MSIAFAFFTFKHDVTQVFLTETYFFPNVEYTHRVCCNYKCIVVKSWQTFLKIRKKKLYEKGHYRGVKQSSFFFPDRLSI